MSLKNINCTALKLTYDRKYSTEHVRIEKPGTYGMQSMSHWKQAHHDTLVADFDIEIDVEKIARILINKAQVAKSGKATAMGGLIKVKRRNTKVVEARGQQVPVPAGWSEVKS